MTPTSLPVVVEVPHAPTETIPHSTLTEFLFSGEQLALLIILTVMTLMIISCISVIMYEANKFKRKGIPTIAIALIIMLIMIFLLHILYAHEEWQKNIAKTEYVSSLEQAGFTDINKNATTANAPQCDGQQADITKHKETDNNYIVIIDC